MTRSNVVLILVDDMGFSDVGCYGSEIATPNIDRPRRGGVRFSQFTTRRAAARRARRCLPGCIPIRPALASSPTTPSREVMPARSTIAA